MRILSDLIVVIATMKKQFNATVKTPIKDLSTEETIEHRKVVLLEDIQSKMERVIEGMESTKETIHKETNEFRNEVNQRFDTIEKVVRQHSGQLQNIEKRLQSIETKVDKIDEHLNDHEIRLTAVEEKLDITPATRP